MSNFIWILFHPQFWIQNYSYCKVADTILNKCMDEDWRVLFLPYRVIITDPNRRDFTIWTSNYPYAAYSIESPQISTTCLAKRKTRYMFNKWLDKKAEELYTRDINLQI